VSPLLSRAKPLGPRHRSGIRRATTCPYRNLKTADRDNLAPCDIGNCCHTSWGVIKAMLLAPVNGGIPISQGLAVVEPAANLKNIIWQIATKLKAEGEGSRHRMIANWMTPSSCPPALPTSRTV
jgi:hypothetical protein